MSPAPIMTICLSHKEHCPQMLLANPTNVCPTYEAKGPIMGLALPLMSKEGPEHTFCLAVVRLNFYTPVGS